MNLFSMLIILMAAVFCLFTGSALAYGNASPHLRIARASTPHKALIYGGDDGETVWEDVDETTKLASATTDLKSSVSGQLDPQLLLRVACSQAPPPHTNLHPKDCLDAHLVSVSRTGAGIAISVTTGGEGVAQLLVPITFPQPCPSGNEDCLVQQFHQLDSESYQSIANKEWEEQHADQLAAQEQVIENLQEEPLGVDLPDWWTFAALNQGLVEECTNMKNLLNEDDFATDVNAIFQHRYKNQDFSIQAIKTCVASVGPFGVYMRSYAERIGAYDDEKLDKFFTAELALQFDVEAQVKDELTALVLQLVESAGEMAPSVDEPVASMPERVETANTPSGKEKSVDDMLAMQKKQYLFQRSLLEARLKLERTAGRVGDRKETDVKHAFQRELLGARLQFDLAAGTIRRAKQRAAFQRRLLEARVRYESKRNDEKLPYFQVRSPAEQSRLAIKYAQIEDVGERAYEILKDLSLV